MNRIILADNQTIFRAGAARVLAMEDDMRIVAQCSDLERLLQAISAHRGAVAIVSIGLRPDWDMLLKVSTANAIKMVIISENNEPVPTQITQRVEGMVSRSIAGSELTDCVRRVARGLRSFPTTQVAPQSAPDNVGTRVRERLTPRELQIVGYIVQGCKNKEIANQLGTKEQVVKNYLRSIYDKTGVSDRLELAFFTIHHRVLAEAAVRAGNVIQMRTA